MHDRQRNKCNLGCRLTKRLLGQVLVDGEFVSQRDLDSALEVQIHSNELLGEILVRMGALDQKELDTVLFVQGDFASHKDAIKAAAGIRQFLGELLIQARKITPEQLELALSEQLKSDEKLGEVLVRIGLITAGELDAVLAFQRHQGGEEPASARLKLGEILVAANHITRKQLEDALTRQRISKKRIGEVLVEAGYAEPHHIEYALKLQQKLITAALVAALSLASLHDEAEAAESAGSAARFTVTATVQARTYLSVIHQSHELIVTNADIHLGYVDVRGASVVEIKNNSPSGYFIVFEGMGGPLNPFKEVHVQGMGRDVQIDFSGGMVSQPDTGRVPITMELSYRFALSNNARPGTYAWPLSIAVIPR